MDLRSDDFTRIARAPAKLNLFLEVLGRRSDGFHELETLMVPVRLYDQLAFTPTSPTSESPGPISLEVQTCWPVGLPRAATDHLAIPSDDRNLVIRALSLFRERASVDLGAHVTLIKRIPPAAGLGGGSSDAACALRLANRAWRAGWRDTQLNELSAELGSDIPFFFADGAALCCGKGERVEALPAMRPLHFVIVKPAAGLSTREVFEAYATESIKSPTRPRRADKLLSFFKNGSTRDLREAMFNRLQGAAALLSPWVDQVNRLFDRLDVVAHQLTGSGSAYFGVCRHAQHARRLASILRTRQLGLVYATRSCL